MYFIANWKMYGELNSIKSLNKVIKFSKLSKKYNFKIIYCPPYTLLNSFSKKLKNTNIHIGGQNCHYYERSGSFTGSINSKMLKDIGAKYVILGHSENRILGENNLLINKKIKSSIKNGLKIIFCIGETLSNKKNNITRKILMNQISNGLKGIKKLNDVLVAYEPVWSIGSGIVPSNHDLENNINFIKNSLKQKFKLKVPKVLYGGSVNLQNIVNLIKIDAVDGFLIGGASQDSNKFIDIVKKTFI